MNTKVQLTLQADDAEPTLRKAAEEAAKFGAWSDLDRRTYSGPNRGGSLDEAKKEWRTAFLRAKRIVEAFGIEYEPTSEEETMTITYPHYRGGTTRVIGGMFRVREGATCDYSKPVPTYRGAVHAEACRQAADRVVRRWRETIKAFA